MKKTNQFSQKVHELLQKKQEHLRVDAGKLGNGYGDLYADAAQQYVFVQIGNAVETVLKGRVPAQLDLDVWVGYSAEDPTLRQVLSLRGANPGGAGLSVSSVSPHAPSHEYGSTDPVWTHLRAITFLRLGVTSDGDFEIFRGVVWSGTAWIYIPRQTLTTWATNIPSTAGKAAWVLVTIDDTGTVVETKGSEVDIADLPNTSPPAPPAGTAWVSGAYRVYNGQTAGQESRNNPDIWDLRFARINALSHTHAASEINMPKVDSPTIDTLAEDFTTRGSSGVVDGTLTYVSVGSTAVKISVAAGDGYIRTSNDQQAQLVLCHWDAAPDLYTFSAPAAGQENVIFIGVEYVAGHAVAVTKTSFSDWNWFSNFPLARCSYDGTTMRILNAYAHAEDTANFMRKFLRLVFPFIREEAPEGSGGLEISSSGSPAERSLAMSAGNVWHGFNRYILSALSSGVAFDTHYRRAGGGFNKTTGVTQWPNTQYDDGTGTLHTMTNNKYACLWVYVDVADGSLDVIYGRDEYTSVSNAQEEAVPTTPAHLTYHGRLVARIIFKKSETTYTLLESAWAQGFAGVSVPDVLAAEERYFATYNYFIGAGTPGYRIGLATSADGRTWTIKTEPVINLGTAGAWDDDTVQFPELLSVNGVLYCYYAGKDGATWANFKIGLAQSFDGGLTWTKHASNPLINNNIAWENTNIFSPVVLYDKEETDSNKRWKMWYAGSSFGQGIGYAYSADGITWTKSTANPVMTPGSGWEDTYIGPKAVIRRGDEFILFFAGRTGEAWRNGIATFTDPEGTYTRSANNPILEGDGISTTLTANLTVGSTTATVADATPFPIGCPVWIGGATRFLTHVIKRNSATSLELADAAPVQINSGQIFRSIAYNSIDITGVRYDDGYKLTITPHQPDGGSESGVHELSMLAYANDDLEAAYIDYSAGVQVPVTVAESQNTHVSRENWSLIDLQETEERHKPVGIPEAVVLFDDAEGNPADVTTGSSADGTSEFASRRDHAHHVDSISARLVMATGITNPPVPVMNAESDNWIYETI